MADILTPFSKIRDNFLSKITDDLYLELSEINRDVSIEELLQSAVNKFEFPRVNLLDTYIPSSVVEVPGEEDQEATKEYIEGGFSVILSNEEINILGTYMAVDWVTQQILTIENTRQKYSGLDFKFTSQANHLQKLITLKKEYEQEGFHLQRLYKRRKLDKHGNIVSSFGSIMEPTNDN